MLSIMNETKQEFSLFGLFDFSKRLWLDFFKEESSATSRVSYLTLIKIQLFLKCKYRKTSIVATPADNENQLFIWFNAVNTVHAVIKGWKWNVNQVVN